MLSSAYTKLMASEAGETVTKLINVTTTHAQARANTLAALSGTMFAGSLDAIKIKLLELYASLPPVLVLVVALAAALGVIAGLVGIGKAIANAVVTPGEHLATLAA